MNQPTARFQGAPDLLPSKAKSGFSYRNMHYQMQSVGDVDTCYQMPCHGTGWEPVSRTAFDAAHAQSTAQVQRWNRNDYSQG